MRTTQTRVQQTENVVTLRKRATEGFSVDERWGRKTLLAILLLVGASAAWGSTFVVMKSAVAHAPVPEFLAWRFLLAGLLLLAARPGALARLGWRGWSRGAALGSVLAAGYLLQTYGLQSTPAAVSGFLTGLQVIFTPLLGWLLLRHRPGAWTWMATLVATGGLGLITLRGLSIGSGEILTIASAALFALQIVGVGRWVSARDSYGLATVQLLVVGMLCLAVQSPRGVALPASRAEWWAVIITSLAATAFAFVVQLWAQSRLSAIATSVIVTLEPVFAALFAVAEGESIGWSVVIGGGLVVASMLVLAVGSRAGRDRDRERRSPDGPAFRPGEPEALQPARLVELPLRSPPLAAEIGA